MSTEFDWAVWPETYDRIILDEVDSTNAEAIRRAPGITRPTWVMARRQTASRARRGRKWEFIDGNFAASLLIKPDYGAPRAALETYVASYSLLMALRDPSVAPSGHYTLKWPNDVLLNGGKVAGILLESSGTADRLDWLVIGIGVNLAGAPHPSEVEERALRPVSVMGETGVAVRPEALLEWLASFYDQHTRLLMDEVGFDAIRRLWLAQAAGLGQPITARTGNQEAKGIFETVDEDGNLVLRTRDGLRRIAAADVYFD